MAEMPASWGFPVPEGFPYRFIRVALGTGEVWGSNDGENFERTHYVATPTSYSEAAPSSELKLKPDAITVRRVKD